MEITSVSSKLSLRLKISLTSCILRPLSQCTLGTHLGCTGALVQGIHRTRFPEQQVLEPQHHDVRAGGTWGPGRGRAITLPRAVPSPHLHHSPRCPSQTAEAPKQSLGICISTGRTELMGVQGRELRAQQGGVAWMGHTRVRQGRRCPTLASSTGPQGPPLPFLLT